MVQVILILKKIEDGAQAHRELRDSGRAVHLLSQGFKNLASSGYARRLTLLKMTIKARNWGVNWSHTASLNRRDEQRTIVADTYRTTLAALAISALPIDNLDVFMKPRYCGLATNEVGIHGTDRDLLVPALCGLKSASFNLVSCNLKSTELYDRSTDRHQKERLIERLEAEAEEAVDFNGLVSILELSPKLEEFNLQWQGIEPHTRLFQDAPQQWLFQRLVEAKVLTNLQRCELKNVSVDEGSMLLFLEQATGLKRLVLADAHMSDGSWSSVFDHIRGPHSQIEYVDLHFLLEVTSAVSFMTNSQKYPGDMAGRIRRDGRDEVERSIKYRLRDPNKGSCLGPSRARRTVLAGAVSRTSNA